MPTYAAVSQTITLQSSLMITSTFLHSVVLLIVMSMFLSVKCNIHILTLVVPMQAYLYT